MTQLLPSNTAFGLQLTAVGDDSYSGQSMALLYRLENTPWTLRTGVQHDSDDTKLFIGASYNTF
ncbi:hypothetical protein BOW44_12925 [Solemya velum gill symbiont]|nr:hypothetical protein [Solemya velum gill symbiont]OOZ58739.1 hypothetical protein BOW44_12925 [Solemya velum gill symbiont]